MKNVEEAHNALKRSDGAEALEIGMADNLSAVQPKVRPDGVRVHTVGVYEMLWDCRSCGTRKLLGKTHRFCPNCGAGQDSASRYFPADDEKVEAKDHVYVGADRICDSCSKANSANTLFCTECGATLTDAELAKRKPDQVRSD